MASFTRQQWGARAPERQSSGLGAVGALVVHHVGGDLVAPTNLSTIMAALRQIQSSHLNDPDEDYCVDPTTEAMTLDGWKRHDQLNVGDLVLTLNTETMRSEWQPVLAINRFQHDGPMLWMKSKAHSSLTTANHRWFVRRTCFGKSPGKRTEWRTSDTLNHWTAIPTAAPCADLPTQPKYTDAMVETVAWLYTEGCYTSHGARIDQSEIHNPACVTRIRAALAELFGPVREYRRPNGMVSFNLRAPHRRALDEVCPDKVPASEFLRSLTYAQLRLFLDVSVSADGTIAASGTPVFGQKDPRRVAAFEMAAALAGIQTSTIRTANRSEFGQRGSIHHLVSLIRKGSGWSNPYEAGKRSNRSMSARVAWVPYRGLVWCPTTPNGTWLARRAGSVFYTGNSDIAYNAGVDQLGNDYELRGMQYQGGATYGANDRTKAVLWVGDSNVSVPTEAALQAIARVYQRGVANGHLVNGAVIGGHRDYVATACPGTQMYVRLPQIRALAGGTTIPNIDSPLTSDGDDDVLTPDQAKQLEVVANVLAPSFPRFGRTATMADAMETMFVNFTQMHESNQQVIALLRSIDAKLSGGTGGGASADQVVDALVARLSN